MTKRMRLELELSEKRSAINALLSKDDLTEDERGELGTLTTRAQECEIEFRAAVVAEGEPAPIETRTADREAGELANLITRASVGDVFAATLDHRVTDGATAEVQQHFGIAPNQVAIAMLETRAVTPAPADVGQQQAEVIPAVFPMACAAFLGVDMPTVGVGEAVYPVLTASAVAATPAENALPTGTGIDTEGHSTGTFAAEVLSPSRIQASFFYSREDRARFRGMGEALRTNLSEALSDALDMQVLSGSEGLLAGTKLANHNVSAITTFANYVSEFGYSRVDGKYAGATGDLRVVMGSSTYAHAGVTYRHQNADDIALERLVAITGGVKVSAHVPAVVSHKQNSVIRLGMRRDMVAPIWEGITLIPDEISKAANGQIVVTAVMLYAVKILRAAGFYKQQTQHA